jgi:hypothetical protein
MTREALAVYRRHLAPDGIIAFDITNSYLRLAPVVAKLAEDCGMGFTRIFDVGDDTRMLTVSDWMLLTNDESFLQTHLPQTPKWSKDDPDVPLWTDQYSNMYQILSGGLFQH